MPNGLKRISFLIHLRCWHFDWLNCHKFSIRIHGHFFMIQHAFDQSFVTFFNHFFIMHRSALLTKNHQIIRMSESNCFPQNKFEIYHASHLESKKFTWYWLIDIFTHSFVSNRKWSNDAFQVVPYCLLSLIQHGGIISFRWIFASLPLSLAQFEREAKRRMKFCFN